MMRASTGQRPVPAPADGSEGAVEQRPKITPGIVPCPGITCLQHMVGTRTLLQVLSHVVAVRLLVSTTFIPRSCWCSRPGC
jgi:hypothetical protein